MELRFDPPEARVCACLGDRNISCSESNAVLLQQISVEYGITRECLIALIQMPSSCDHSLLPGVPRIQEGLGDSSTKAYQRTALGSIASEFRCFACLADHRRREVLHTVFDIIAHVMILHAFPEALDAVLESTPVQFCRYNIKKVPQERRRDPQIGSVEPVDPKASQRQPWHLEIGDIDFPPRRTRS